MELKYQAEIEKRMLLNCPANVSNLPDETVAFRFSYEPIEHPYNFLPNILIDEVVASPFNYAACSPEMHCIRCGSSLFVNREKAQKKWNRLPIQFKENYGYTHLAQGVLNQTDGVVSIPNKDGHYTFYESVDANLVNQFEIVSAL